MELKKYLLVEGMGDKRSPIPEVKYSYVEGIVNKTLAAFYKVEDAEEWEPNEKETVYLFPFNNVDRKKLKVYCDNNGFSLTTKPEKATIAFIDPVKFNRTGGSKTTICKDQLNMLDRTSFLLWANENLPKECILDIDNDVDNVILHTNLENYTEYDFKDHTSYDKYKSLRNMGTSTPYNRRDTICYYHPNSTLRNMSASILKEECLLEVLNKGMTLTEQSFHSICKMLNSSDSETTKMAYQIMSDVDYKSSAIYLLLIFSKFDLKIANSSWSNKTNFKGLLKFMGLSKDELYWKLSTGATIKCMKKLGLYNQTNVLKLSSLQDIDFKTRIAKDLAEPLDVSSGFISDSDYLDIDVD